MAAGKRMVLSLVSLAVIVALSLTVAYVTFGLLQSSAQGEVRGYKFSGAIAAFVFTSSALTTVFFNLYKLLTADQLAAYEKQIQELQAKVIKGAPCPQGYSVELDERHKLVFARPSHWEPRGGILYAFVDKPKPADDVSANFTVIHYDEAQISRLLEKKVDPDKIKIEELYNKEFAGLANIPGAMITKEYIMVDGHKSAKHITTFTTKAPTQDGTEGKDVTMRFSGIITYVPHLKVVYVFTCTDNEEDFLKSSEIFNTVISSIRFL
jgi:hypothetical protein